MTEQALARPEFIRQSLDTKTYGVVEKPLSLFERIYEQNWLRKIFILVLLAAAWQAYATWVNNVLLFPTLSETFDALIDAIRSGGLLRRAWFSISLLLQGYAIGLLLAAIFTGAAVGTRIGQDLLETLTAMFNPLPAIALLPLSLLWFGLGNASLIFVLIHSVLWAVALNTHSGFKSVSTSLRMVGRNYGLSGISYICKILIPAAFPSILTGLKIGWAFAWRTLIAAELVFGASSGKGGLGWYIFQNRNELYTDRVFAGLATVVIIGLLVEGLVFRTVERITVRRWGMER
jgi:NitT/TauT family transport system permease protein